MDDLLEDEYLHYTLFDDHIEVGTFGGCAWFSL